MRILQTFILFFGLVSFALLPAKSQGNVDIQENTAEFDFPFEVLFTLNAISSQPVTEINILYGTNGRSCSASTARQNVEINNTTNIKVEWLWDLEVSGNIPPGAEIWWQWEIQYGENNTILTERKTLLIEDGGYTWKSTSNEQVSVYWVEGGQRFGQNLLRIASESLEQLSQEAGIAPEGKVRLTIYPSFDALRNALLAVPEWTGGIAFPEYGSIMIGIAVDSGDWAEEVIPHELAHLVTGELTFNCLGIRMPTWLSEGLSVYAEGPGDPEKIQDLKEKATARNLPSLRSLAGGFPANADLAGLAYLQSGEVVRFMITSYGPEKMAGLLDELKNGSIIDSALEEVYGLDTDSLDLTWQASIGVDVEVPTGKSSPTPLATSVATMALWTPSFPRLTTATVTMINSETPTPQPSTARLLATQTSTEQAPGPSATPKPDIPSYPLACLRGSLLPVGLLLSLGFGPKIKRFSHQFLAFKIPRWRIFS